MVERAGVLRGTPSREPRRLAARVPDRVDERGDEGLRVHGQPFARGAVRIEPPPIRVDDDLLDGRVEPRGCDLARERRAHSKDEVGALQCREPSDPQERVVGRDRVRAGAQIRDRIGEQRPTQGVGERGHRLLRRARAPTRHDQALLDAACRVRRATRCRARRAGAAGAGSPSTDGRRRGRARRPPRSSARAVRGTRDRDAPALRVDRAMPRPSARRSNARLRRHLASRPAGPARRTSGPTGRRGGAGRWSVRHRCRAARAGGWPCTPTAGRRRDRLRRLRDGSARRRFPTCSTPPRGDRLPARDRARRTRRSSRRARREPVCACRAPGRA